jgi:hypothetical protein
MRKLQSRHEIGGWALLLSEFGEGGSVPRMLKIAHFGVWFLLRIASCRFSGPISTCEATNLLLGWGQTPFLAPRI